MNNLQPASHSFPRTAGAPPKRHSSASDSRSSVSTTAASPYASYFGQKPVITAGSLASTSASKVAAAVAHNAVEASKEYSYSEIYVNGSHTTLSAGGSQTSKSSATPGSNRHFCMAKQGTLDYMQSHEIAARPSILGYDINGNKSPSSVRSLHTHGGLPRLKPASSSSSVHHYSNYGSTSDPNVDADSDRSSFGSLASRRLKSAFAQNADMLPSPSNGSKIYKKQKQKQPDRVQSKLKKRRHSFPFCCCMRRGSDGVSAKSRLVADHKILAEAPSPRSHRLPVTAPYYEGNNKRI